MGSRPQAVMRRFQFDGDPHGVRAILDDVAGVLVAHDAADRSLNCQIVLAEVLNNIIEHAYRGRGGPITLDLTCGGGRVAFAVADQGDPLPGIADLGRRFPPLCSDAPMTWPEGGFGWALVRELARNIRYDRTDGTNRLQFDIA